MMTRELCIMACVFCREPDFRSFVSQRLGGSYCSESQAKAWLLTQCQITSRRELDTNPEAAQGFHDLIRKPYLAWKESQ